MTKKKEVAEEVVKDDSEVVLKALIEESEAELETKLAVHEGSFAGLNDLAGKTRESDYEEAKYKLKEYEDSVRAEVDAAIKIIEKSRDEKLENVKRDSNNAINSQKEKLKGVVSRNKEKEIAETTRIEAKFKARVSELEIEKLKAKEQLIEEKNNKIRLFMQSEGVVTLASALKTSKNEKANAHITEAVRLLSEDN